LSKVIKWGQVAGLVGGLLLGFAHFYYAFQTCKQQAAEADLKANRIEIFLTVQYPEYPQMTGQLGQIQSLPNPASK